MNRKLKFYSKCAQLCDTFTIVVYHPFPKFSFLKKAFILFPCLHICLHPISQEIPIFRRYWTWWIWTTVQLYRKNYDLPITCLFVWLFVGYFLTATYTQELTISQPKHLQGSCLVTRFAWRNNTGSVFLSGKSKGFLALSLSSIYVLAVGNRVI